MAPPPARADPPREPRPILRSFAFAWNGLAEGVVRDRNLRIHLGAGVLVGAFVARAPLAPAERGLLVVCVAAVLGAEMLNSALEAAVDLASPRWSDRARLAKDSAAATVLALAAGSVLAFAAIAAPRLEELLGAAAPAPAAGSAAAALAAGLLPARVRGRALDAALLAVGAGGIALVARGAESQAGTALAGLCLAVSAGGAARRRPR